VRTHTLQCFDLSGARRP